MAALVATAGVRRKVEEPFQTGKGLTCLDEHQVQRYLPWRRWTVLVMLAHTLLTVVAAEQPGLPADSDMIPLTRNEITHLLAVMLFTPAHPHQHRWAWSAWRRRRQFHARRCHYQRREAE